jgi:hypothetical protein
MRSLISRLQFNPFNGLEGVDYLLMIISSETITILFLLGRG